jgi:STE24 endopeptidase
MNESKATRYQRLRRRVRAASVTSAVAMLAVVALTPLSPSLGQFAKAFAAGLPEPTASAVALVLFVAVVAALWELAGLPAAIYLGRRVDPAYGQAVPTVEEVVAAHVQAALIALPMVIATGAVFLLAVRAADRWWWLAAGPLLALLLVGALRATPLVLGALATVRPVARPELTRRLEQLAVRARVPIAGIGEWVVEEPAPTAAMLAGIGRTRRILLSSDLVLRWSDDEIVVVVAHELAHHVHGDLWRTVGLHVVLLWAALFVADVVVRASAGPLALVGPGDLAALPLIGLATIGVWILTTPIRHAQSRRQERRADVFALAVTGGIDAFGTAVTRLGARRLAEERPSVLTRWMFHSHPSVAERLALAETFRGLRPAGPAVVLGRVNQTGSTGDRR